MDLAPDELIVSVRLPPRRRWTREHYRKVGTRRAQAISKVCFAGALDVHDGIVTDVRLAFGSVAPAVHPRHVCRGGPARTTAGSEADRRRTCGARPGHRADRRHALDGAVQGDRRGERDGSVPRGELTADS